jgi:hypothetical protein
MQTLNGKPFCSLWPSSTPRLHHSAACYDRSPTNDDAWPSRLAGAHLDGFCSRLSRVNHLAVFNFQLWLFEEANRPGQIHAKLEAARPWVAKPGLNTWIVVTSWITQGKSGVCAGGGRRFDTCECATDRGFFFFFTMYKTHTAIFTPVHGWIVRVYYCMKEWRYS